MDGGRSERKARQVADGIPVERSPADVLRLVVAAGGAARCWWSSGCSATRWSRSAPTCCGAWTPCRSGSSTSSCWAPACSTVVMLGGGLVWTVLAAAVAHVRHGRRSPGCWPPSLVLLVRDVVDVADGARAGRLRRRRRAAGRARASRPRRASAWWRRCLTAAAPWLSRRWRRAGWALLVGLVVTRFLRDPGVVRLARGGERRLARRRRRPRGRSAPRPGARRPRPSSTAWRPSASGCGGSTRPASTPAARRRTSARPRRRPSCSSRRSATTSAAPTSCSGSTAGSPRELRRREAVRVAAPHGRARGAGGARRPRPRRPDAPAAGVRHRAPQRLRARLRGDRGAVARRRRPDDEFTDAVLHACWRLVGQLRQHRIAHRDLRLANVFLAADGQVWLIDFGFSELAASDLLLANDVAELIASSSIPVGAGAGGRPRRGHRRPGDPGPGARPAPPLVAQRCDAVGAQGAARPARRPAGASRQRSRHGR